ncbi:MAG: ornithine cyclodeaminase, partial [Anaerostipes sp.]|nr:ornithine cyclodeaminase [Anaerostipes sp.]
FEEYDKQTGKRLSSGIPGMYFVNMIEDGEIDSKEVRHLGDIVRGIVPGRTSDDEMFLVSVGGMPILDVAWGKTCYDRAVELGYGTNLKLWDQPYFA